jgi:serine/threonine protein kinase
MDQGQKRATRLPHELQKACHPKDDKSTLPEILEEKLSALHASETRLTQLQSSTGQGKANKVTKPYRNTKNQSVPEPIKNNDFLKREHPSGKYLMTWEVNQAGIGRLGLENCAGYKSRVVVKKIMAEAQHQSKNLRATADQYLVNLQEVFFDQGYYFLVYPFQGFAVDLAVTCATPHVQFSEADIATVCRSILKGLDYIHEVLQVSHGNLDLKHILLSENGCIKIGVSVTFLLSLFSLTQQLANIGRSLLEHQSLKGRRDDIKSVGLFVVYLKDPATILEDKRKHLYNPQKVSNQAKGFIEEAHTAPCKILLQVDFPFY